MLNKPEPRNVVFAKKVADDEALARAGVRRGASTLVWLATVSIGKMAAANGSAMKFRASHEKM
ncbi:hypothetical protein G6321_00043515 [Bradyrhizobium barranii subsp. barranii]|uniref:Uncharacterized protein n=1 Tax=Bradyrhizobium barranii subsp. barranii TaxID=2823807 RepID=A0A7Z0TRX0_9BRAD|nr:hypothetical protein [Bradyrhizobium barranii]UGX92492.1 hypothetical protein G6321_00043515 [Bradyrhizobium barranii subsp. barranii]